MQQKYSYKFYLDKATEEVLNKVVLYEIQRQGKVLNKIDVLRKIIKVYADTAKVKY